ncbi:hypothetical protein OJ253_2896 [Cryptosporidium canis]|uniref:RSE1/DDB1/CPSF1 C-terminal domain-containing protein n=1 Tax=Cryptosporidium canis TaxID=195482 RepID=A0A9D5HUW3_9CRYT|nr:hypothetical protein OJ253_2896 [Cryptosporidium canis]
MAAALDTYCTGERPEFSVFGHFVGRREDGDSRMNVALIKGHAIEIYELAREKRIRLIASSRLLLTPMACTSLKGTHGMPDYIVMLFSNWQIAFYRYSSEYGELELVSKDLIEIGELTRGASLRSPLETMGADDYIKLDRLETGDRPHGSEIIFMITTPKFLLFITYKVKTESTQELSIGACWGILVETDIYMDTVVDSCQILEQGSGLSLHPKIAILTRVAPVSTGSIQSHSNCVSLIYLSINMELTEFTILDKLELLPTDSYKLIPFDTRGNTSMCLSGGLLVLCRNSVIVHGGLNRPLTLITTNDSYEQVPEKKLEIDICTQKAHSFRPKTFGFDTGSVLLDNNSATTAHSESIGTHSNENSSRNVDLRAFLSSLQPKLMVESDLSLEFDVAFSVPFLITNDHYGILFFSRIQPYLFGLVLTLSASHSNGIRSFRWFKVYEYWDWSKAYLPNDETALSLETTTLSARLSSETVLDEHYLITTSPIFQVQNVLPIQHQTGPRTGDLSLVLIGDTHSNSGISILDLLFQKNLSVPYLQDQDHDPSSLLSFDSVLQLIKSREETHSLPSEEKNKRAKKALADSSCQYQSLEDLDKSYIYSDISRSSGEEVGLGILESIQIRDYLDIGPNSLRDFCLISTEEPQDTKSKKEPPIGAKHAILSTNGSYPVGQLCLLEKTLSKSVITQFSLDDILFHWTLNDPLISRTKYLVFTSDPLKSIGKTYFFSLDTCDNQEEGEGDHEDSSEMVVIGDVNQLDPSDGSFEYEADSNTVGVGVVRLGDSYDEVFVIQTLPSTINVLNFGISARLAEIDLHSALFSDQPDAPMAVKSLIIGPYIPILFEDSTIKILKVTTKSGDDHGSKVIAEFSDFEIVIEGTEDLFGELDSLYDINQLVIRQRVMDGDTSNQLDWEVPRDEDCEMIRSWRHQFWIRHVSTVIMNSDRRLTSPDDLLVVMVIYSRIWLNGALAIYNLAKRRLVFFSPFISAVPCLMGNVLSLTGSKEETIYRFLEAEFDLGRPVTSPSTPIIEPKYYIAKEGEEGGGISVSPALPLSFEGETEIETVTETRAGTWAGTWAVTGGGTETKTETKTETEHSQSSSSFLISCELVKMEREDSKDGSCQMILVASVTQKPILIYRLEPGTSSEHLGLEDLIFSSKWKLQVLTNLDQALADISKFFVQFPSPLTCSNIQETFSSESPLSIYNCGHGISFNSKISNDVDTWIIHPPSTLDNESKQEEMSDVTKLKRTSDHGSLAMMADRGRFSVVRLDEAGTSSCIAKIDSPWSPLHLLLTTSRRSEINFEFLNLPFSSLDPKLCCSLSLIPPPGGDNWFLRRAILPEVLIQRVAYCKEHDLVAVIVGLPDNVKHHLNGYHIRQMALYRYFRCLEAGGKEAQAIISNQDLVRNPEQCFEMSLSRIPDLGIPPADFASETYFDTLPPGIEIGETMPKIFHQSNMINGKAANSAKSGPEDPQKDFEREQFGLLKDPNIMRSELLIYSLEDLFPQMKRTNTNTRPEQDTEIEGFPKPRGRFAFGAWEVGLSMRFGKDSKGQQILLVGTGTNPTHYYEAEGRLLIFKVKQLAFLNDESGQAAGNTNKDETEKEADGISNGKTSRGSRGDNMKWTNMLKYWPSKFSKLLYHDNVYVLETSFQSMYRGPVTNVDLINLPATTAPIAPSIPALAAYPIIQNNTIIRGPNANVTYISHTFGYRLFIHELRESSDGHFIKGTFMDTPLGISSVAHFRALFFLGDIRRGIHLGVLRTDTSRGSQTMVKLARSHPLWKFTCTSAQAIVHGRDIAILVADSDNNLFTFKPNFSSTQIIDKETLQPASHISLSTSLVHMKPVESNSNRHVIASGRNGSFFSIKITNKTQHEHLARTEKLLFSNIPSFLGISPNTLIQTRSNQTTIPKFIQNLFPTDKIIALQHIRYLKYLSNPILQSIFKNSDISLHHILQFIS